MNKSYIDGKTLKNMVLAGSKKVIASQEELNKINVFPVPDGDTGSNMASTFESISQGAMAPDSSEDLPDVSAKLADSALNGARGNSGAILAQFFHGLADGFGKTTKVGLEHFANTAAKAAQSARDAIANPVEGTIITVMHDWAHWLKEHWHKHENIGQMLTHSLDVAKTSLKKTPEKLEALRKAKVVDAGAQGFVNFLQGVADYVKYGAQYLPIDEMKQTFQRVTQRKYICYEDSDDLELQLSPHSAHDCELEYQYCTECIVHGHNLDAAQVRETMSAWGNSLVVVGNKNKIKIHIHSNDPERVFRKMGEFGDLLATKADDMWAQYRANINWQANKEIALITDSSCMLPREFLAKYNIISVPLQIMINNRPHLDGINLSLERFCKELVKPENTLSTSQPLPQDWRVAFDKALRHSKAVIGVFLSGEMSGTFQGAQTQAQHFSDEDIRLFDSQNAGPGAGLIVQAAAEAIHAGKSIEEVTKVIERVREKTKLFVSPKTLAYMVRGGRVNKYVGFIGKLIRLLPVLEVNNSGTVSKAATTLGLRNNRNRVLKLALKEAKQLHKPRFVVSHVGASKTAEYYITQLEKRYGAKSVFTAPASPLIVTHSGPGTVAIGVTESVS